MAEAAAAAGGGRAGKKELHYGATYKAYTESGEAHFNTYHDGLRELVDNSVEYALQGNAEMEDQDPEIKLLISLKGRPEEHTLAVGDNGRGMNEKQLDEFAQ
jgi:DNA gyrase/topoisomerase IV subunit B